MRSACCIFFVFLSFAIAGCGGGDTHEEAADDLIDLVEDVGAVIETVEDQESAETAKQKLIDLSDDFRAAGKRLTDLGAPSESLEKKLEEKYRDRLDAVTQQMGKDVLRIRQLDPAVFAEVQQGMEAIGEAMEAAEPKWMK